MRTKYVSVIAIVLLSSVSSGLYAARRCGATCAFSGSTTCGRGQVASCSCTSTGLFSSACSITASTGQVSKEDMYAREAVIPPELTVSIEQQKALRNASKLLRSRGPQYETVAKALDSLATARTTVAISRAQQEIATSLTTAPADARALLTSMAATAGRPQANHAAAPAQ